jgi:hypothetical protein
MILMTETIADDIELVTEDTADGKKNLYIEGIFLESERKNRNGRIYPKSLLEREVNKYRTNYVDTRRALGELEHPQSATVNPDRASHRIVSLTEDGNNFRGKALLLDTPCGNIVRGIVEGGSVVGVSSRALGSLTSKKGVNIVNEDLDLRCVDIVLNPSAIDAFVEMVMENAVWVPKTFSAETIEEVQGEVRALSTEELIDNKYNVMELLISGLGRRM